jgi:protein-tyrosine-phosphatase
MNTLYTAEEIKAAIQQLRYLGWRELHADFADRVVQMMEEQRTRLCPCDETEPHASHMYRLTYPVNCPGVKR